MYVGWLTVELLVFQHFLNLTRRHSPKIDVAIAALHFAIVTVERLGRASVT